MYSFSKMCAPGLFMMTLFPASSACAQFVKGDRIRVEFKPDSKIEGRLIASDDHSISVESAGGVVDIERASIQGIKRYEGKQRNTGVGLIFGGTAGLMVGAIVAGAEEDVEGVDVDGLTVAGYAVIGALVGAAVGTAVMTDRWETFPHENLSVSTDYHKGEFKVGLNVSF